MSSAPTPPSPLRILVVDDEKDVRDSLDQVLRHFKHSVQTAGSADDALALFDKGKFDLVITDYRMEGKTGADLAREVKQRSPKTPVLMITAFAEDLQKSSCALENVQGLIPKPFRVEELKRAIAEVTG